MKLDLSYSNNWRKLESSEALNFLLPILKLYGITRVANITGLDFIDIPVYTAFRPRALTLVVSCGKGISHNDSAVSAIMESIETDVAERLPHDKLYHLSYSNINKAQQLDHQHIPALRPNLFDSDIVYSWVPCKSLYSGIDRFIPAASIGLSSGGIRDPLNTFVWGSNGLASGFTIDEARLSALYELIERDAVISWQILVHKGLIKDAHVDLSTISYETTKCLINAVNQAGLHLYVFDRASDLGLPVYRAILYSPFDCTIRIAEGLGCHHSDEIALNRAITEAVQTRTVVIAGARDDITLQKFESLSEMEISDVYLQQLIYENHSPINNELLSCREAIVDILRRLTLIGFSDAFEYVFRHQTNEISVVRIYIPGLQPYSHRYSVPLSRAVKFTPRLSGLRSALYSLRSSN